MSEMALREAVKKFADVTRELGEQELEKAWAWQAYASEGVRFAFFRTYEQLRELAIRIMHERTASGVAISSAQRTLAGYHAAYRDLRAALSGLSPEQLEQPPAEGEWPVRKILAHIAGADMGFYVAVHHALERHRSGEWQASKIPIETWDTLLEMDEAAYDALMAGPFADLVEYHENLHEKVLHEFAAIREEELELPSMYWEPAPMSLRFRLHRFESHMRQHTIQVDKALAGIGQGQGEAKRLLRLIYTALAEVEGATIGAWQAGAGLRREAAWTIAARAEEIAGVLA